MKKFATIALATLGLNAFAGGLPTRNFTLRAPLESISVARGSHLDHLRISSGRIEIKESKNEIELTLLYNAPCPAGMVCPAVMSQVVYNVPKKIGSVNNCNIVRYTGSKDERPVDGFFEKITVIDNSNNTCPTTFPLPETEIDLEIRGWDFRRGREFIVEHFFTAGLLERLFAIDFDV